MYVELYTKPGCQSCSMAKRLMILKDIEYKEQILDEDFTREFILEKFPTATTFPIIVIDGFYIGGYNQLKEMVETNSEKGKLLLG